MQIKSGRDMTYKSAYAQRGPRPNKEDPAQQQRGPRPTTEIKFWELQVLYTIPQSVEFPAYL